MVFRGLPFGPHWLRFFTQSHQTVVIAVDSVQKVLGDAVGFLFHAFIVVVVVFAVVNREQPQYARQQLTIAALFVWTLTTRQPFPRSASLLLLSLSSSFLLCPNNGVLYNNPTNTMISFSALSRRLMTIHKQLHHHQSKHSVLRTNATRVSSFPSLFVSCTYLQQQRLSEF